MYTRKYTVKIWDTVCVTMCTPATCYKPLVTSRESRKGEGLVDKGKETGILYNIHVKKAGTTGTGGER